MKTKKKAEKEQEIKQRKKARRQGDKKTSKKEMEEGRLEYDWKCKHLAGILWVARNDPQLVGGKSTITLNAIVVVVLFSLINCCCCWHSGGHL